MRKRFYETLWPVLLLALTLALATCGPAAEPATPAPTAGPATDEAAPEAPTASPPADEPGSTPEPAGGALDVEPPPTMLEIAGQEQVSGIGSYCWSEPAGEGTGMALCADMAGIPTVEEPLAATSPFIATFHLGPEEMPDELTLDVFAVTAADQVEPWPSGSRGWDFKQGERYSLPLDQEPSLQLSLNPGLYVLALFGRWQPWGDATYGFLVEVRASPPALTVEETPIVVAEVDGPGHFEYTARLGEQILARIQGMEDRAAAQALAGNNEALAPFGYRLEGRDDDEWNRTFYDLYRHGESDPLQAGLSSVSPVSINASGTDFVFAAENAPNVFPLYLLVWPDGVEPWDDAGYSNWLPPVYVEDSLARLTFTGFPTLTYQIELSGQPVYSGTALAEGAYMPLQNLVAWDGHWALEVDDRVIVDGQDLGQALGYGAVFGFSLVRDRPFYFFEEDGQVRISYDGQTLPNVYDRVFHNQCCEASIHNVRVLGDAVLFHALRDGTWYFVEAGVHDGERSGTPDTTP